MRIARQKLILAVLWGCFSIALCSIALGKEIAADALRTARIKKAISDSLCYDIYWAGTWGSGEDYRRGVPLPLKLWIDGKRFFALIDPVGFLGKHRQPVRATRVGLDRGDRAVVVSNFDPKLERRYGTRRPIIDTLIIPNDCTPHYDPATPKKEMMLKAVVDTVRKRLGDFVREGVAKYPRDLTVIIADFNVDYPSTYILVDGTKDIYSVTLHDFQNYDSDEYERKREYPFGEEYNKSNELLAKVRKHGIRRKITLAP